MGEIELTIDDHGYGVIDEKAKDAFTTGQCHALAAAIKEKTGWIVKGVGDEKDSPAHCVVWCPQLRRYVDINGTHDMDYLRYRYMWFLDDRLISNSNMDMDLLVHPHPRGYLPPAMPEARAFARTVLRNVNQELRDNGYEEVPIQ